MPTAKKDDVNIVQIESEGYNQEKGEGPVHLIGSHCIDFFASMDGEANDTEDEDDEMEVKGKGDDLPVSPIKTKSSPMEKQDSKKRKASEDEKAVEKKAKTSPAK